MTWPVWIVRASRTQAGCDSYSHDLNPIGNAFSRPKAIPRKAAARTVDGLQDAIRGTLPRLTPQDCASHLAAAGHEHRDRTPP